MLFKSLALKNFKCFEEVEVEFAPITLLTGANSSGKSSLIYSLLAMLQTEQFPLYLSPNGKYVNMGSFKEMVFRGDISKTIQIDMIAKNEYDMGYPFADIHFKTKWNSDKKSKLPYIYQFDAKIGNGKYEFKKISDGQYQFSYKFDHFWGNDYDQKFYETAINSSIFRKNFTKHNNLLIDNKSISINEITFNSFPEFKKFISDIDDFNTSLNDSILEYIEDSTNMLDNWFNYLGSFRLPPERTYYQKAKAQEKVGVNGEGYIDQIIEWEETNPEKFKELNEIMAELELIQSIQSEKMKGGRFELTVKTKENSTSASLTDVGFGISQFLPLIVADLQLPETSCLALSQPEIHLHPKIQALFGNYLAKQINKSGKQYIVETHSEYLLNRIRLLLVKGELRPEDVRVYYFENDGIKSVVHNVEFTTDGQIKGAPDGFFDTYGMDVMDIALNA